MVEFRYMSAFFLTSTMGGVNSQLCGRAALPEGKELPYILEKSKFSCSHHRHKLE
jgi:hypothetical protein